jgi:hypothetical protein
VAECPSLEVELVTDVGPEEVEWCRRPEPRAPGQPAGAFSYVITARTPGAASAAAASIPLILPAAIVDCTRTACARPGKATSSETRRMERTRTRGRAGRVVLASEISRDY